MLPPGGRGGTFLPGLGQKITVNATGNPGAAAGPSPGQPTIVTFRPAGPSGNPNPSGPSQPHFVTIPKESVPDGMLKSGQSHQQFVTMVPKSSLGGAPGGGQIVTIRAPLLSGGGALSGTQNQLILQQGSSQATLLLDSSGKPHLSYLGAALKNGMLHARSLHISKN